jgi:hypothetical protein
MIQNSHQCLCTKHIKKEHSPIPYCNLYMHAFSNSFHGTSCKNKMLMNVRVWNYISWLYKKKVVKSIGVHY